MNLVLTIAFAAVIAIALLLWIVAGVRNDPQRRARRRARRIKT